MRRMFVASVLLCCLTSIAIARLSARRQTYGPDQQPPGAAASPALNPRDISGFWELSFDSRKVPKPRLLPTVTAAKIQARAKRDDYATRWCNLLGMPFLMDSGRPLDIRQGATAVIITPENASPPRYLYLNRAAHVPDEIYDPSTNGDSIAHWDGDTLVVETIGFHADHGITAIPGGGFRTDKSRLAEQYRLLENGQVLSVTFAWTDPTVFRAPHTYEFRYYRLPASYEPRPWLPCDPYDEVRTKFIEGAPAAQTPVRRSPISKE